MKRRSNTGYYKVGVQDAGGTTAPTLFIPKESVKTQEDPDKQHKEVLRVARNRSGLGRFSNWNFR